MGITILPARLRKFEIPGRVTFANGSGGLPKINITTGRSTAEIYQHGAHITGFQKNGEPPLLFMSRLSQFAAGKAICGGVPVCFPWFGQREGDVIHGFARITEWDLIETAATPDGGVTIRFRLPSTTADAARLAYRAEFVVAVTDQLAMELIATNESADRNFDFENCPHTYFAVGDILDVSIAGLKGAHYLDKTDKSARKLESAAPSASRRRPTGFIPTPRARWKSATRNSAGQSVWTKTVRRPPWFGIRGRRSSCLTSTRRNTGKWSVSNPATWDKIKSRSHQVRRR
jgi:hypothetical protein